jgi:hypothetical protein
LAVATSRFGVEVHAYCSMSTHVHMVVTDTRGLVPLFLAQFHRIVALATKVMRRWGGSVWDSEQTSLVLLETPQALIDKAAYVMANPVAAGLVRYASDWTGAKSYADEMGSGRQFATRPGVWFSRRKGAWPERAELQLVAPKGFDPTEWRAAVADAVVEHEQRARAELASSGRSFVGLKRLEAVSPYARATSLEVSGGRNPTFAVGKVRGAYRRAAAAVRAFREAYHEALRRWREGVRDVVFPIGTWWMARVHSVLVAT